MGVEHAGGSQSWWEPVPWSDVIPGDVVQYRYPTNGTGTPPRHDCPVEAIRRVNRADANPHRLGQMKVTLVGPDTWRFDTWVDAGATVICQFPRDIEQAVAS